MEPLHAPVEILHLVHGSQFPSQGIRGSCTPNSSDCDSASLSRRSRRQWNMTELRQVADPPHRPAGTPCLVRPMDLAVRPHNSAKRRKNSRCGPTNRGDGIAAALSIHARNPDEHRGLEKPLWPCPCRSRSRDRRNLSSPNGIRTRVSTLRGWCPRPLDDGAMRDAGRSRTASRSQGSA